MPFEQACWERKDKYAAVIGPGHALAGISAQRGIANNVLRLFHKDAKNALSNTLVGFRLAQLLSDWARD